MPIPFKDALFKLKNSAITISQHPVDGISNSQGSKAWVYFAGVCMALASVYLYIRERTFKGSNFKTSDFRTYFTCLIQWFRSEKKWLFLFLAILFLVYLSAFLYPYLLTDETWLVRPGTHIGLGHGFGRYLVPRIRVCGFKGGFPPVNPNPCQATTFHGFLGIEAWVVRAITRWVSQVLR